MRWYVTIQGAGAMRHTGAFNSPEPQERLRLEALWKVQHWSADTIVRRLEGRYFSLALHPFGARQITAV